MAPRGGFHTITLGCKLNRFDSAALEGELLRRGLAPQRDRDRADVVVINTCTVTHKADREARKLIRSVRRSNPGCRLIVTGCYAELEPERLRSMGGIDLVFGNRDKPRVGPMLERLGIGVGGDRGCDAESTADAPLRFGDRARAFLKIQEGCRLACSYCIIPTVRGPSRSVPAGRIEGALGRLVAEGYREVVLTGVNTGDYGRDLGDDVDLAGLLRRLLAAVPEVRLRLNSLEPLTITDAIVELIADEPRLASHLQVPLQSGSPAILRAMRRNYRLADYAGRVERLRRRIPDIGLGADVIVGFPGETDARFEETMRFVAASPLSYLHVFAWSPRPGTPASGLPGRVAAAAVRERSARLRALGAEKGLAFRRSMIGRRRPAVLLACADRPRALTDNFIEVSLEASPSGPAGALVDVRIDRVDGTTTWGRVAEPGAAARSRPVADPVPRAIRPGSSASSPG